MVLKVGYKLDVVVNMYLWYVCVWYSYVFFIKCWFLLSIILSCLFDVNLEVLFYILFIGEKNYNYFRVFIEIVEV